MRNVTVIVATVVLAAACGGSDEASPSAAGFSDKTTIETPTTIAPQVAEIPTNLDEYCELRATAEAESDTYFASDDLLDPTATEAFFVRQADLLNSAIEIADPEIVDALEVVRDGQDRIEVILSGNGYDMAASFDELSADKSLEVPTETQDLLDVYDLENCGLIPDDSTATDESENDDLISRSDAQEGAASLSDPDVMTAFIEGMVEEFPSVTEDEARCIGTGISGDELLILVELVNPGQTAAFDDETAKADLASRVENCGGSMAQFAR